MESFILGLIIGAVGGGVAVYFMMTGRQTKQVTTENKDEVKKKENFQKIEKFISQKEQFANDDLQKLLGVSDTTVGRYLDEMEKEGKIKQIGKTGVGVFYTKNS